MTAPVLPEPGTRVKAVSWQPAAVDDNLTVPPGTEGTVVGGSVGGNWWQLWVTWDNGSRLSMVDGDRYEVLGG